MAEMAEIFEVGAEEAEEVKVDMPHIVLAAEEVEGKKVSAHLPAQPVAKLWLGEPVFPPLAVGEAPCVEVARHIKRPFRRKGDFHACVDGRGGVVEKIGL